jgi:hypothetical protein
MRILLDAARPRTRELYSRDLVVFLSKGIPQSPPMSTDNFAKKFYVPLMKSLNDLIHLHDLLSEKTSKFSKNKAKMPELRYQRKPWTHCSLAHFTWCSKRLHATVARQRQPHEVQDSRTRRQIYPCQTHGGPLC